MMALSSSPAAGSMLLSFPTSGSPSCSSSLLESSRSSLSIAQASGLRIGSRCKSCSYGCFRQFSSLRGVGLLRRIDGRRRVAPASPASRQSGVVVVVAEDKPDVLRAAGFLIRVGKEGLDAGTNLVPEPVPRGVARVGVGIIGAIVVSWVLRSLFSTALFILAIAGFSYLAYSFVNKDTDPDSSGRGGEEKGSGSNGRSRSTDDSLEEARRIMEKYK